MESRSHDIAGKVAHPVIAATGSFTFQLISERFRSMNDYSYRRRAPEYYLLSVPIMAW